MFHLPPSRNVRFVSFALALIALTMSAALLSHRSSAASAGFNDKPNPSKPASERAVLCLPANNYSGLRRTTFQFSRGFHSGAHP